MHLNICTLDIEMKDKEAIYHADHSIKCIEAHCQNKDLVNCIFKYETPKVNIENTGAASH